MSFEPACSLLFSLRKTIKRSKWGKVANRLSKTTSMSPLSQDNEISDAYNEATIYQQYRFQGVKLLGGWAWGRQGLPDEKLTTSLKNHFKQDKKSAVSCAFLSNSLFELTARWGFL